jgi:hypothetical protein
LGTLSLPAALKDADDQGHRAVRNQSRMHPGRVTS